jgi:hypothetical protein
VIGWPKEHNGFKAGDKVRVAGERGNFEWVNVHLVDGEAVTYTIRNGRGNMRFFSPERVSKKGK